MTKPKGVPWMVADDIRLLELLRSYPGMINAEQWARITDQFPGRTIAAVASHGRVLLGVRNERIDMHRPAAADKTKLTRMCLRCRKPFESWSKRNNWLCMSCRNISDAGLI